MNPYTVVVIKPDAHKDVLVEMILDDLTSGGLEIVLRKDLILSQEQAEMIYESEAKKEIHDYAVKSLLPGEKELPVTLAIVRSAEGTSAIAIAREIKGKSGQSGVRSKYQLSNEKELKEEYELDDEVKTALAKNRLHVPDTDSEAMEIMNALITHREKEDIRDREPELYKELRKELVSKEPKNEIGELKKKGLR